MKPVYHVGDLSKPRVAPHSSLEGGELSVSHHPESWKQIAQLGGTVTALHNPKARFFVVANKGHEDRAVKWASDNGYLQPAKVHRVTWHDSEAGHDMYSEHHSEEDLRRSHGSAEEMREEGKTHEIVDGHKFGPKGEAYHWSSFPKAEVNHQHARSFAPIFYAKHHGYDGVMWNEPHEPENLSAPRGLIFQEKLPGFRRSVV
jgi:hypothetical protein